MLLHIQMRKDYTEYKIMKRLLNQNNKLYET